MKTEINGMSNMGILEPKEYNKMNELLTELAKMFNKNINYARWLDFEIEKNEQAIIRFCYMENK
jgi:hypothetical protein